MENDSLFQADLFFRIQLDFPKGHFGSVAAGSVFDEYFDSCRIIRRIGDQQTILLPEDIDMVEIPNCNHALLCYNRCLVQQPLLKGDEKYEIRTAALQLPPGTF